MVSAVRVVAVILLAGLVYCFGVPAFAQARIVEETRSLETYPFGEPDPVPILGRDARLYPYHPFAGYSVDSEPRDWQVVRLENDYIEVFVLPEVGGKVWGARVKETGHEFIYRNEVMKFRNISLRGPWTSGGIEFNFGVIGHTPATATPVDYVLRENDDGSVSCIVGSMDLPSRTHWRVEIRLPADTAYFETNVLWFNPTPLEQPFYNWMTAAAFAQDDLEMSIPGDRYLRHSGEALPWPADDQGRDLAWYGNNDFGGSKSYHVVGELNDFFGGYYHDEDYGFGHWARYEEMPGQKLWIWALSRQGGIWEDLLTDTDGQYIEFQAGPQFVQYQPGAHENPITKAGFDPLSASRWSETWFPLEGTGGLTDASRDGAMYVERDGDELTVNVIAFIETPANVEFFAEGRQAGLLPVPFEPLGRYQTSWRVPADMDIRVRVTELGLDYESNPSGRRLSRSFDTDPEVVDALPAADRLAFEGHELLKARRYDGARAMFEAARIEEPSHIVAALGLADLDFRSARYERGLERARLVLQIDAYHAKANFLAGLHYRALGRIADARDAFGWASRDSGFRSAAYVQLAELMIASGDLGEAEHYARLALDYDRYSVPAWRLLAVIARSRGNDDAVAIITDELLAIDPLHHFAHAERYLAAPGAATAESLVASLGGEYPLQSLLELVALYAEIGRTDDALALLRATTLRSLLGGSVAGAAGAEPLLNAWQAFLENDANLLDAPAAPTFTFPFRRETLPVLAWAREQSSDWVWTYLHGLNLWAVDDLDAAGEALRSLRDTPDFAPFYVARAELGASADAGGNGWTTSEDLRRAVAIDPSTRVLHVYLARHLLDGESWQDALEATRAGRRLFPDDFNLALLEVEALLAMNSANAAIEILQDVHVLPSEHARTSHQLWQHAHTMAALDSFEADDLDAADRHLQAALEWPERLGQGRPYDPEERMVHYVQARVAEARGDAEAALVHYQAVVDTGGAAEARAVVDGLVERAAPSSVERRLLERALTVESR